MWRSGTHNTAASTARTYQEDLSKYGHPPPRNDNQTTPHGVTYISNRLLFAMLGCLVFGVLLLLVNVLQLRGLSKVSYFGESPDNRPVVLVYADRIESGYLDHVLAVFTRVGYVRVQSSRQNWDVLWSHEYPFSMKDIQSSLKQLQPHQKVNHFPGSGYITNKHYLAISNFPFHPPAFALPKDKKKFLKEITKYPKKMWVEKSNSHRGIHIKTPSEINIDNPSNDAFVEEFITNPLLINKRKCDLGIYTVLTSINPLRVYIYEDEMLIRCCIQDYHPLDPSNEKQYVVGDEYTQPWDLDSLKLNWEKGKFSRKMLVLRYLIEKGKDGNKVWSDIKDSIREVYVKKEVDLITASQSFSTTRNFFEMVRFDFILDEDAKVWLMEVNMSPNLSSGAHTDNAVMYEQVVFNLLGLVGVANRLGHGTKYSGNREREMQVSDMDVMTSFEQCASRECRNNCIHESCQLCNSCLSEDQKSILKMARAEHVNRGGFRRVLPPPMSQKEAQSFKIPQGLNPANKLMTTWFRQMCLRDPTWCY